MAVGRLSGERVMLEFTKPTDLHGDALEDEINAAGWPDAEVSVAGDTLRVAEVSDNDRDEVKTLVDNHVPPDLPPDVGNLKLHVFDDTNGLGRNVTRQLVRDYPDLLDAVNERNWTQLRAAIDDAHTDGALTDTQHSTLLDILNQNNVP